LSAKSAASIELPPPVAVKPPSPRETIPEPGVKELLVKVQEDNSGSCPVCEKEIMNPTAVQTGYVFCYPCVFRWVQDGVGRDGAEKQPRVGRCPVTGVKLLGGTEGLRRLMI